MANCQLVALVNKPLFGADKEQQMVYKNRKVCDLIAVSVEATLCMVMNEFSHLRGNVSHLPDAPTSPCGLPTAAVAGLLQ